MLTLSRIFKVKLMNSTTDTPLKENDETHNESKIADYTSKEGYDNENANREINLGTSSVNIHGSDNDSVEVNQVSELQGQGKAGAITKPIPESESPLLIQHFDELLESGIEKVLKSFEKKLAYDATKQQQIDSLHADLQTHRTDLIARTSRPLVNGLIRLHYDVGKLVANLRKKPAEELDPERFFNAFNDFQDDIEILLDQNGVVSFTEHDENFEPRRQRLVKTIKTSEAHLVGTIAERLRPGFEQIDNLIQKENVSVYVHENTTNRDEKDFHENEKNDTRKVPDAVRSSDLEENND